METPKRGRPTADQHRGTSGRILVALAIALLGYPAVRSLPFFSRLAPRTEIADWWVLWGSVFVGHWLLFGVCTFLLRSSGLRWIDVGLDASWFWRRARVLGVIVVVLLLAAVVAPAIYYGGTPPTTARVNPLGPTSALQRLMWIPLSITAGIVEESVYRGLAITQLHTWVGSAWLAAILAVPGFVFLHGIPPLPLAIQYAIVGGLFGAAFVRLGLRRLEILVIVHAAIDMVFALLP